MKRFASIVGLLASTALGGCAPPFFLFSGKDDGPTVAALVAHIECSIHRTLRANTTLRSWAREYTGAANLTVEITANEGINPSFNFIDPHKVTGTNYTLALGAQLTGTQHRTFNYLFPIDLRKMADAPGLSPHCAGVPSGNPNEIREADGTGISGDLGLEDILNMGQASIDHTDYSGAKISAGGPIAGVSGQLFGTTIDFTVVGGLSGGPNWTLVKFKGPNAGGSGGLFSLMRTTKDTLVLSFAKGGKVEKFDLRNELEGFNPTTEEEKTTGMLARAVAPLVNALVNRLIPSGSDAAYGVAQNNNTQMILQNLLSQH